MVYESNTILMRAIRYQLPELLEVIFEKNPNLNIANPSNGNSALHYSVLEMSEPFARRLIVLSARFDIMNNDGLTAENLNGDYFNEIFNSERSFQIFPVAAIPLVGRQNELERV